MPWVGEMLREESSTKNKNFSVANSGQLANLASGNLNHSTRWETFQTLRVEAYLIESQGASPERSANTLMQTDAAKARQRKMCAVEIGRAKTIWDSLKFMPHTTFKGSLEKKTSQLSKKQHIKEESSETWKPIREALVQNEGMQMKKLKASNFQLHNETWPKRLTWRIEVSKLQTKIWSSLNLHLRASRTSLVQLKRGSFAKVKLVNHSARLTRLTLIVSHVRSLMRTIDQWNLPRTMMTSTSLSSRTNQVLNDQKANSGNKSNSNSSCKPSRVTV